MRSILKKSLLPLLVLASAAGLSRSAQAVDAPTTSSSPITTDLPGVTAHVAFARQYGGVLHVGIELANPGKKDARQSEGVDYAQAYVLDPTAKQKHFPLKDTAGNFLAGPVSDANHGGRWFPEVPRESHVLVWMLFDAVPAGRAIEIHYPSVSPITNLVPTEGAPPAETSKTAASVFAPVTGTLTMAHRDGKELKVQIELANPGKREITTRAIVFKDVFALDPAGKKKYGVMKDTDGKYVASPVSDKNDGGRWFARVPADGKAVLNLTFQAPPDSVKHVDVVVPWFAPFENVAIEGTGTTADAGSAVAGATKDLDAAMKDLDAEKTAEGIKVALSSDLLFDFDKSDLKPAADPKLAEVGKILAAYPDAVVQIDGYTDAVGNPGYNMNLSERRARTVATWLEKNAGVSPDRIRTKGYGKDRPIAPNKNPDGSDNPEGRAKNRRVEIFVKTKSA